MTAMLIARRSELAQPGDFVVVSKGPGERDELAAFNYAGEVHVFDNVCPHRGARIFTEPSGNRPPVCAYHGRCARPHDMRTFCTRWVGDWLFAGDRPPEDVAEPLAQLLQRAPALRLHSSQAYVYQCDARTAVENALDFEHVAYVHANSLARLRISRERLQTFPDGSSIETFRSGAARRLDAMGAWLPRLDVGDYVHMHIAPQTCLSTMRGWTWSLQQYLPRHDGTTWFSTKLFVLDMPQPNPAAEHLFKSVSETNAQVFAEDAVICAQVRPEFEGRLGPLDDRIKHFRQTRQST